MKKARRLVYIELAGLVDADLCTFCRFHESGGCDCPGNCKHPLSNRMSFPRLAEDPCPGDDCWAFRPHLALSLIVDIIGIVLTQHWVTWAYWMETPIRVVGQTREEELAAI